MKFAKYLTAFSVFSVFMGTTLPANAVALGKNIVDITSGVGSQPNDVLPGSREDNDNIFFFEEKTNFKLNSDLGVDGSSPDDLGEVLNPNTGTPATISSGEEVNSYFFQYSPVTTTSTGSTTGKGNSSDFSATFNNERILGLIFKTGSLNGSDSQVGLPSGVTYPTTFRGIENNDGVKFVNQNTIEVTNLNSNKSYVDGFRVVTEEVEDVPESSSLLGLLAVSVLGAGTVLVRKQA